MQNVLYCAWTELRCRRHLLKLLIVMKLTMFLLTAAFLNVSACGLSQTVNFSGTNVPLEEVFKAVKKQTGFVFFYDNNSLKHTKPVTIDAKERPLNDFLKLLFNGQPLEYRIKEKNIIVRSMVMKIFSGNSFNNNPPVKISGTVVGINKQPLVGATVRVKGKNISTSSNASGYFELNIDAGSTLIISYVGFYEREVKVNKESNIIIELFPAKREMDTAEVVVSTGYQSFSRHRATGSFVHIDNAMLNRRVGTNILNRLDGIASGLIFNPNPDVNLKEPAFSIRTRSTINSNTWPLIVVDNFPYTGDLNTINPNDIESITILKDAAAASVWGAYSGNGVVVITTKKGRYSEPLRVSVNSNLTIIEKPDLFYQSRLSSANSIEIEEYLFNKGVFTSTENNMNKPVLSPAVEIFIRRRDNKITEEQAREQLDLLRNTDTRDDLKEYFYRPGINQQHSINFSGGSQYQQYFFSVGYDKNISDKKGASFDRLTLNANNTYSLFKRRLEITSGVTFANNKALEGGSITQFSVPYAYLDLVDDEGNALAIPRQYRLPYVDTVGQGKLLDWHYLPYEEVWASRKTATTTDYRLNGGLKLKIVNGLDIQMIYQFNKGINENRMLYGESSFYTRDRINKFSQVNVNGNVTRIIPIGGIMDKRNVFFEAQNFRTAVNFNRTLQSVHNINFIAGLDYSKRDEFTENERQYGYKDEKAAGVDLNYYQDYPTLPNGALARIERGAGPSLAIYNRNISYFSNIVYSYQDKYAISASVRKDESNLFGVKANQRGVPLWSVGIGWEISKEPFYHCTLIPFLKLKITTGYSGNVNTSLSALTTVSSWGLNLYNRPVYRVISHPNSSLRWEKVRSMNIAVEFRSKNDRLSGNIEYYDRKSIDLIGAGPIDPTTGFAEFTGNTANMQGRGIDIALTSINIKSRIRWSTSFLFNYAKDKVTQYNLKLNGLSGILVGSMLSPVVGNPVLGLYTGRFAGLDPSNGEYLVYFDGKASNNYREFANSTNLNNLVFHGTKRPLIFGSVLNSFGWRKIDLSINFKYSFRYFFKKPSIAYNRLLGGELYESNDDNYEKRWQKPGDEKITNIPSIPLPGSVTASYIGDYQNLDIHIERGDHIRIQDIRLSYQLPDFRNKHLPINNMVVYGYINNIGILWKSTKTRFDPDYLTTLPQRTFSIGLTVNF